MQEAQIEDIISAIKEEPELRETLLSLLQLPDETRQRALMKLQSLSEQNGAPKSMLSLFQQLQNNELAEAVVSVLKV